MPFVIYDFETTGLSWEFDQALQIAAVKTDDQLNEIDSFSLRCRLAPHIVPSPKALLANRIPPSVLTDAKLPSRYEFFGRIREKFLEWSPAVFLGYNSIEFDELFLRHGFYQSLQPIYLTNTGGSSRGDVMRIAHATAIYAPTVLRIPTGNDGEPTYRLEKLAPANGYISGGHHEAGADVKATLFLADLVRKKAGQVWEHMTRWTSKRSVFDFMTQEDSVWHSGVFGPGQAYSWRVTYCGRNPENDSQLGAVDLQYDPQELIRLSVPQLVALLNSPRKRIRVVTANKQPILMPAHLGPAEGSIPKVSAREIRDRVALVRKSPDFQQRLSEALAGRYPKEPQAEFVEQRIYEGFPSDEDKRIMEGFHATSWEEREQLLDGLKDERSRELGQRLIYLEQPQVLPNSARTQQDKWVRERVLNPDPKVPWMTIPKALAEVDERMAALTAPEDTKFLKEVKSFLKDLQRRVP